MKPTTLKKERLKTTLKRFNPFKSEGKQRESNESLTPSSTSASTSNLPDILDATTQAESQASTGVGPTPLSQTLEYHAMGESSAQISLNQPNAHPRGPNVEIVELLSIPIVSHAKSESQPQSDDSIKDSPILAVIDATLDAHPNYTRGSSSAARTTWNATRNVVDAVGQAADAFPPLKSAIGGITAILKTYDQIKGNVENSTSLLRRLESLDIPDTDEANPTELKRRSKLSSALDPIQEQLYRISRQSLLQRAANNVQDNEVVSSCVEDLRDALTDYQVSLQHDLHRMGLESISKVDFLLLAQLPRAKDAGYSSENHEKCQKGTRIDILEEIWAWAIDFSIARAYWLNGVAGTGKSTIAQTLAEWCFAEGLLGASFFCSRDSEERSDVKLIFPTIAFQLAEHSPEFREALITTIRSKPDIGHESLFVQLEKLLLEPLKSTKLKTIIIIDALDECKDKEATSSILSVLGRIVEEIPSVKIFITGRPEPRIRSGFRLPLFRSHTEVFRLHEVQSASVDADIQLYLRIRLPEAIRGRSDLSIYESWPDEKDIAALARKCSGLFVFAATACRVVMSPSEDPRDVLKMVINLENTTVQEGMMGIDALYTSIMEANVPPQRSNTQSLARLQTVLGAIATAFNPLSRFTMEKLLGVTTNQIKTSLRHLHSVIHVPDSDSQLTKIYHKSFPDYLTDSGRCMNASFYINVDVHHARMAIHCLEVMGRELRPNICDLPSYSMNDDIEDLSDRRKKCITDELEYACRFWARHLASCSGLGQEMQSITRLLQIFFKKNLLSWLEVLSIMGDLPLAVQSLVSCKAWFLIVHHADSKLFEWANDAERYVLYCFEVIQQSAPHIYASSIFWLPSSSIIRKEYLKHSTAKINSFMEINPTWDRCTRRIQAGKSVNSIALSDDGKLVAATGTDHGDTYFSRIFEVASGMTVLTIERKDGHFYSPVFSRDASLIFVGSVHHQITAWDMQTGGLVREYQGSTGARSVSLSPSGSLMASGLWSSIGIWDVASGERTQLFEGHSDTVWATCWSPKGEQLLSGSDDKTLKLWNPTTGLCLKTIETRQKVHSVAYSPDASYIASASGIIRDATIELYDAYTGDVLQSIPTEIGVNSISFSPCGTKLLCSTNKASFIWDIEKKALFTRLDQGWIECALFSPSGAFMVSVASGILRVWQVRADAQDLPGGRSDRLKRPSVYHITHAPDGKSIFAGSADGTIRIWDVATSSCTHTLHGHTNYVQRFAFSTDASLFVSCSHDRTEAIRIWDMREKKQLRVMGGRTDQVIESLQFICDDKQVISHARDYIKLWSVETGQMLAVIEKWPYFMGTDGVRVSLDHENPGSTIWTMRTCLISNFHLFPQESVGFIPMQDRPELYDGLLKPQQKYRYLLEGDWILDQRHRTISWLAGERKWIWSDKNNLAGERFPVLHDRRRWTPKPVNEEWVVDQNGRRVLWIPQDLRGCSSSWGRQLAIGLEDGRVITLDFTDV